MPTTYYLRDTASDLGGAGQKALSTTRGAASTTAVTNTAASGTNIQVTKTAAGQVLTWFSPRLSAGEPIAGSVTVNIRGAESSNSANAKAGITIELTDGAGNVQSTVVANTGVPTTSSEYALTTDGAKNASFTPTSTDVHAGDRIKVTLFVKNQGTMGGVYTVTNTYDGPTAAAAGDTYVTFTETLTDWNGSNTVTPAVVSAAASFPASSPSAGVKMAPSVVSATASIPAPVVSTGALVVSAYVGTGGSSGILGSWTNLANAEGSGLGTYASWSLGGGEVPSAPTAVTSIAKDSAASVAFLASSSQGSSSITHYVVTPHIAGTPQTPTVIAVASLGSITGSDGNTYKTASVSGLTNDTAYTFKVQARNSYGDSAYSAESGANTPMAGLIFGDDFNGSSHGTIHPEHWLLDVASTSDEDDYYRPDHVYLDGSGHIVLHATNDAYGGKPYTSGCFQNNTENYLPAAGNTLTFETRAQVCPGLSSGMWPAPWLAGTAYQQQFKTDQQMTGWDSTTKAEIDYAEWNNTGTNNFDCVTWASSSPDVYHYSAGLNTSAAQHIYRVDYKPGVSVKYYFDGVLIHTCTSQVITGRLFHMWYQQIQAGASPTFPQDTVIDYLRIYDRNLG